MTKSTSLLKKTIETSKSVTPAKAGRVFTITLKGVPRVDAKMKARLDAAARTPGSSRRDYPQVIAD
jgi:hypothetical protein